MFYKQFIWEKADIFAFVLLVFMQMEKELIG